MYEHILSVEKRTLPIWTLVQRKSVVKGLGVCHNRVMQRYIYFVTEEIEKLYGYRGRKHSKNLESIKRRNVSQMPFLDSQWTCLYNLFKNNCSKQLFNLFIRSCRCFAFAVACFLCCIFAFAVACFLRCIFAFAVACFLCCIFAFGVACFLCCVFHEYFSVC